MVHVFCLCPSSSLSSFPCFLFVLRRIFSAVQPSTGLLWTGPSAPHQERIFLFRLALRTGHEWRVPVACVCVGCDCSSVGCIGFDSQWLHACMMIVAVVIACSTTACLQLPWLRWKLEKEFFQVIPTGYVWYVFTFSSSFGKVRTTQRTLKIWMLRANELYRIFILNAQNWTKTTQTFLITY